MSNDSDKILKDANEIKDFIRNDFEFLIDSYGFIEDMVAATDTFYSETRYIKNDWTISIKTTAHGTRLSLQLISPDGEFGFLTHLFSLSDNKYDERLNKIHDIHNNIKFNSECLKQYGKTILEGDASQLKIILDKLINEQEKWMNKTGIAKRK